MSGRVVTYVGAVGVVMVCCLMFVWRRGMKVSEKQRGLETVKEWNY